MEGPDFALRRPIIYLGFTLLSDLFPQESDSCDDWEGYSAVEAKKASIDHPYTPPPGRADVRFQQSTIVDCGPVKVGLK